MGLHTATFRGKHVEIVFRDGARLVGRFIERTPGTIVKVEAYGRVHRLHKRDIIRFCPLQGPARAARSGGPPSKES